MKKIYFLFLLFAVAIPLFAQDQLINGGFESWESHAETGVETPEFWEGNNECFDVLGQPQCFITSEKTTDSRSGTYAAKISTIAIGEHAQRGWLITFYDNDYIQPFSANPESLELYYRYNKVGDDSALVSVVLTDLNDDEVAFNGVYITSSALNWTKLVVPLNYVGNNEVKGVVVSMSSSQAIANAGTYLMVDDLQFQYAVTSKTDAVENNVEFYPVPAKDILTINSNQIFNKAIICNPSGSVLSEVEIINNEVHVGTLSEGIYFIQLKGNEGAVTKKFIKE